MMRLVMIVLLLFASLGTGCRCCCQPDCCAPTCCCPRRTVVVQGAPACSPPNVCVPCGP
jgi:hypothetical protein